MRSADGAEHAIRLHGLPGAACTPQTDMINQIGLHLLGGPVTIVGVLPSDVTARAGLRAGDQIIHFAGRPVDQAMDLIRQIRTMPEQDASIGILRNDQPMMLPAHPDTDTDLKNPTDPKIGRLGMRLNQKVKTAVIQDEPVATSDHAVGEV